ncbi:hypothetical protein PoB_002753200 [Plakobranchus ocellatus]|uniref:Uncharacterized protein n=1 Tax=Plakobranchus ocellatus TaxID=259542 RepID=A0AAV4A158_9GAST|nr:hypothetical protein PoB_002753200 [Plakobranchus ocellatus]
MREYLGGEEPYSTEYMRKKLMKTLDSDIVITNIQGKDSVVTIRMTAEKILHQFWKQRKESETSAEKFRIIHTAAKLILADVKDIQYSKDFYPTREVVGDLEENANYLPASLLLFLQALMNKKNEAKLKTASIGQAMMQAMGLNILIPPLQIGLGVQLHHLHGFRALIDLSHSLGYCSSYHEVQCFEQCAASSQGTDLSGVSSDSFIQFVADNVDHNLRTLEGLGTFHAMGIIGAATPSEKLSRLIRRDTSVAALQTSTFGQIPVHFFSSSKTDISLKYEKLQNFRFEDITKKLDLLWKVSWPLRTPAYWKGSRQSCEGHFLVDSVLNALLASSTFDIALLSVVSEETDPATDKRGKISASECEEMEERDNACSKNETRDNIDDSYLSSCLQLFDQVVKKEVSAEVAASSQELDWIEAKFAETKSKLLTSCTSRLWLQYMEMLDIFRRFIKVERTGNWNLHLYSMKEMLRYLTASEHSLYAKSVYIYLQQMQTLQEQHPEVFSAFSAGYHVLRRSDRFWAELSTDLVIEQTLMRSMKSVRGLARGRDMGDSQLTQWLLSRPACADMHSSMQEVTGSENRTSGQHAESS